tara:strand:- start:345 stop:1766 length:1422 start_codon:yes stop_codon:yes gene_type:complete
MEEISLNLAEPKLSVTESNSGAIKISVDSPKKSVNFGPGAEMLMNQNKSKSSSPKADINLDDLSTLDNIDLNTGPPKVKRPSFTDVTSNLFSGPTNNNNNNNNNNIKLKIDEPPSLSSTNPLPGATSKIKTETDDGFKTFNEIPVTPTAPPAPIKMSPEETLKEKLKLLRALEAMEKKGIQLTKKYTMDSPLAEMKGEYETIKSDAEKKSSVKFQRQMMLAAVSGLEFLNGRFDPFDLKLDGWSEAVQENIDEYDDVFGELHEKYGGKAKMAPELKLLFMLGGSAAMLHMTNTMFKSAMPGMDDIMRQNPELMQQFQNAAMNTMGQQNPGFGQFMGGVMGGPPPMTMPPMGSPPGPDDSMRQTPPRMNRARTNRPDIEMSRSNTFNDAIDPRDNFQSVKKSNRRPEMKGPSDLDDILSGLKTKKINLKSQKDKDSASVVSISELNDMKDSLEKPKKSRRKPRSERNTISLNFN